MLLLLAPESFLCADSRNSFILSTSSSIIRANCLATSLELGRLRGLSFQHARINSARSDGNVSGIFGLLLSIATVLIICTNTHQTSGIAHYTQNNTTSFVPTHLEQWSTIISLEIRQRYPSSHGFIQNATQRKNITPANRLSQGTMYDHL